MLIAVPSKGRAGETTTQKILKKNAVFYVPESEIEQYKAAGIKRIVGVPLKIKGITATRNYILKTTDDPWVVMIDDDVRTAGWIKIFEEKGKHRRIKENVWIQCFERFFDLCDQLGYKIWGLKTESALRSYYPYKPFLFRGYITASCMGIINDGTYYFDETYTVKEDYELCLRHIKERGGILCVRYLYWENYHWETEGGCKDYRTVAIEKDAIKKLRRQYPGMIKMAKRKANKFTIELNL